jgi:LacI family transcriptional regulator
LRGGLLAAVLQQGAVGVGGDQPPRQASNLLRALQALNIRAPDAVSVLAFDDPEWSELVTPRLSVVRQPAVAIAQAAWRALRRRLDDPAGLVRTVSMKQVIDFRESIGPAPRGR